MRIHVIQHVPFECPGLIQTWAEKNNFHMSFSYLYEPSVLPSPDQFDLLAIMGGPMSANDEEAYSWLRDEKRLIRTSLEKGKKVLGVCLGAQLIASSLGARIYRNPVKEIGWFPVQFTKEAREHFLFQDFPESATVFHWHGETFDLPRGATLIASSSACKNQGFICENSAIALQFHLEETGESLRDISEHCLSELVPDTWVQSKDEIIAGAEHVKETSVLLFSLLDKMASVS